MRLAVLVAAILMPVIAYVSQTGIVGPSNGEISGRYPTLLVAAGYAFSIWGVIFLFDLVYAGWQARGKRAEDATLRRAAPWATAGFLLTGIWTPLFSLELFWPCLLVMFAALGSTLMAAFITRRGGASWLAWVPLSLHAGWLSLAAFLNLAQVIVAYELLPSPMLPWSLALFAAAAVLLISVNQAMRGNIAYGVAALWGLAAVFVKQRGWALEGSEVAAWVAVGVAAVLLVQTVVLVVFRQRESTS